MPALVRLYIRQCIWGFVIAAALVALLIGLDVGHLRHLVLSAPGGYLALFLLWMFNGIVFSGVQFGIAIMGLAEREDDAPRGPRGPLRLPDAIPVPVTTDMRRGR